MCESYMGEIRMFGGYYAPSGWAFCDGQINPIADNQALYSLIGATYGGDGRVTYGLPDMRGRLPMHQGNAPTLTPRLIGSRFGVEQAYLTVDQIPPHSHTMQASRNSGTTANPAGAVLGVCAVEAYANSVELEKIQNMAPDAVKNAGVSSSAPHNNMMPYICVSFIISMRGTYPTRS